ncbi:iron-containing redox enzyme family protein [Nocardia tengchongensis]|uniref:Iron-containing redox enzyme family protein n=1 Tax=Nocardia tengchongensis TaxID=2055889 RepID=A0ABX8CKD6_9NOCA|nr:iron-containing redox enzyme family protein [Nocardia tengchongensis]QVI19786.1 iron-containing redox enzyme family protein [Nocardia tengchongensis]
MADIQPRESPPAGNHAARDHRIVRLGSTDNCTQSLRYETDPRLPEPRGELSEAVVDLLRNPAPDHAVLPDPDHAEPYGDDLQLALHVCYELHYRGFDGIDPAWEWEPDLLRLRAAMERPFLSALRFETPGGADVRQELDALLVPPARDSGIAGYLAAEGSYEQLREFFVHRSIYHHKEGDPHAWVIPRLRGQEKASLVAVEFDEFGGGRGERLHAQLYVNLMAAAGLNTGYLHYLGAVPAPMLAVVNVMSLFGLHRQHRGALIGQLAAAEITSSPAARRMLIALQRLGAAPECLQFYAEHVEADAVHEQVMRRDVVANLLAHEPDLTESVVLGIQSTNLLEDRFCETMIRDWHAGDSSLRTGFAITD